MISFWFDRWHSKGPLYPTFSNMDIYQSRIPRDASVWDFFHSTWQPSSSLHSIMDWIQSPPSFEEDTPDSFIWNPDPTQPFSVAQAWNHTRKKGRPTSWHSFVWDSHLTPRHSFLLWIVSLNRLPTQVLLIQNRRIDSGVCAFCRLVPDSINHLFFECSVTSRLAVFWATKCNIQWRNRPWLELIAWASRVCGGPSFAHRLARFSLGALCHTIWIERNNSLFRNKDIFIPGICKHIIKMVKDKVLSLGKIVDTLQNRRLQRNWELSPSIFS